MSSKNFFKPIVYLLILIFIGFLPQAEKSWARRGGWVSSGGELFEYDKNPWFVKNTVEVKYCLLLDESTVSATRGEILNAIVESIDYWKAEFSQNKIDAPGFAELATQNFTYQDFCDSGTDIQFKVGIGALNEEEKNFLEEPKKYVGVTVRTSNYDLVNLRAKGFVYISSDKGPDSYENPGHLIVEAWQYSKLLKYVLIHELGHIFGIPHSGAGLMSEVFMDQLLSRRLHGQFLSGPMKSYMHPAQEMVVCALNGSFDREFFQVPSEYKCLELEKLDAQTYKVKATTDSGSKKLDLGLIKLAQSTAKSNSGNPVCLIHLPAEQVVFSKRESFLNNYMIGPVGTDGASKGFYRKIDSHKPLSDLYIEMKPESFSVVGHRLGPDGKTIKIEPVFVYSPPNLLKLQLPIK